VKRTGWGWAAFVAACVALMLCRSQPAFASVTLLSFTGARQSNGSIVINWQTASEIDTSAFRLHRSNNINQTGVPVTTVAPSGSSVTGASYSYTDPASSLSSGTYYYYRLEEISTSGTSSWYGPVTVQSAYVSGSITRTAIPTDVPTATRQFTNTPVLPTAPPTTPTPVPPPTQRVQQAPRPAIGPAQITTPTSVPGVAAPPPPTATPFVPTLTPSPSPTDTLTPTLSPTLRPSATPSRTPAPLVFAAESGAEPQAATPMATPTASANVTLPVPLFAGATVAFGIALGLLALALRRAGRL